MTTAFSWKIGKCLQVKRGAGAPVGSNGIQVEDDVRCKFEEAGCV